jgi:hypothetical protein
MEASHGDALAISTAKIEDEAPVYPQLLINQLTEVEKPVDIFRLIAIPILLLSLQGERGTGDNKIDGIIRQPCEQLYCVAHVRSTKKR